MKRLSQRIGREIFGNAILNKTICSYIMIAFNAPEKIKYSQHLMCAVGNIPVCLNLL